MWGPVTSSAWPGQGGKGGNPEIGTRYRFRNALNREKRALRPLHETIDHLLLAGLLECDRQLVTVDLHHVAVAEFLVKHAVVEREFRNRAGGFRDQLAFDHHRAALVAREAAAREGIAARAGE